MIFHFDRETTMTYEDPRQVLEIEAEAGDEEIRAAYLRKVKEYPPDRSPREFERVRDAYDMLRDPRRRTRSLLLAADPKQPLASLLDGVQAKRQFTGPDPWLAVSREKKI
jgi:curved DNA-binding protein CbpA